MSMMDSFAEYEIAECALDAVSGGCGSGRGYSLERTVRRGAQAVLGLLNQGSVGGNVIAIAGDVIVNGNGSITIVGGDLITAA